MEDDSLKMDVDFIKKHLIVCASNMKIPRKYFFNVRNQISKVNVS